MGEAERKVETPVCRYAAHRGFFVEKLKAAGRNNAPDDLFLKEGFIGFIEFKAPGKPGVEGQLSYLRKLLNHGADARMCDSEQLGKRIIDEWDCLITYRRTKLWKLLKLMTGGERADALALLVWRLNLRGNVQS